MRQVFSPKETVAADTDRRHAPSGALFRLEAIEAAAGSQFGAPLRSHWRGVAMFTALAGLLLTALVGFAAVVEYAPVQRVPAYLDASEGVVTLRTPGDGFVVSRIAVVDGARVRKGELLAVLSSDRVRRDGSSQRLGTLGRIQDEKDAAEREIGATRLEAAANRSLIEERIRGLSAERDALGSDIRAGELLLASLRRQGSQFAELAEQGFMSAVQAAQKRDEAAAQESRLANVKAALARIERDIATSHAEYRLVEARLSGQLENRRRSVFELERQRVDSDAALEQVIRAPQDGAVSSALIAEGQSLVLGQKLFTLMPAGQSLVARLLVPARAAGVVKAGLDVTLVFKAYPQEKFGRFPARVIQVSDTPTLAADLRVAPDVGEVSFVATAELLLARPGAGADRLQLKPGMLAEALVPVERRTILEWLVEPFTRGFNNSAGRAAGAPGPG